MTRIYVPGIVHVLPRLRDDETGETVEFDIGVHEDAGAIVIEPLSEEGDSIARITVTLRDGGVLVEMAGPIVKSVEGSEGGGNEHLERAAIRVPSGEPGGVEVEPGVCAE